MRDEPGLFGFLAVPLSESAPVIRRLLRQSRLRSWQERGDLPPLKPPKQDSLGLGGRDQRGAGRLSAERHPAQSSVRTEERAMRRKVFQSSPHAKGVFYSRRSCICVAGGAGEDGLEANSQRVGCERWLSKQSPCSCLEAAIPAWLLPSKPVLLGHSFPP